MAKLKPEDIGKIAERMRRLTMLRQGAGERLACQVKIRENIHIVKN